MPNQNELRPCLYRIDPGWGHEYVFVVATTMDGAVEMYRTRHPDAIPMREIRLICRCVLIEESLLAERTGP